MNRVLISLALNVCMNIDRPCTYSQSRITKYSSVPPQVYMKRVISSLNYQYSSRNSSCMSTLPLAWCQSVDPTSTVLSDDNFVQLVIRRILILKCTASAIIICTHHAAAGKTAKRKEKKRKGVDRLVDESEGSLNLICTKKAQSRLHEQEA